MGGRCMECAKFNSKPLNFEIYFMSLDNFFSLTPAINSDFVQDTFFADGFRFIVRSFFGDTDSLYESLFSLARDNLKKSERLGKGGDMWYNITGR